MALRRVRIAGFGEPVVNSYLFDEKRLDNKDIKVKIFDTPCKDWALFIMKNRNAERNRFRHDYDIVIGPIADDGVAYQLERYSRRMITLESLVEELMFRKLNRQYFFGTELAISKLQRL